jgi:hypothetical protein
MNQDLQRKIDKNLLRQIKELRETRKKQLLPERAINQYLKNIYRPTKLMHFIIKQPKELVDEELFKTAVAEYIVFMIGYWETFFRDLFLFILERDPEFCNKICEKRNLTIEKIEYIKTESLSLGYEITLPEYLSKVYDFQQIDNIKDTFNLIFNGKGLFSTIGNYPVVTDKGVFCLNEIKPDWLNDIKKTLNERHNIVHNANYIEMMKIDKEYVEFISSSELTLAIFPQIFMHWIADKYKLEKICLLIESEDGKPNCLRSFVFLIDHFIAEDWVEVK